MRTNLITSRETDLEVVKYAAERGIGTYKAMNELLKVGLGYYQLFGMKVPHVHVWILNPTTGAGARPSPICRDCHIIQSSTSLD
jgi:hypothetical protein